MDSCLDCDSWHSRIELPDVQAGFGTLVYAVVNGFYDALWVGVLVHEASVILVILNGARLAEGTGTITLVKETFLAMWEATRIALDTGLKQLSEMRS